MLKELRTQHRSVIQMSFSGYKNKEIAERLEMSDCNVSTILRSPLGQAYLEGLQDKAQEATLDVRKKLVSMNKSALRVLENIMNPEQKAPFNVQLTAAKDVLDRTGYKAPDRLSVDMTMSVKTDAEIDAEIAAVQGSIAKTYLQSPGQAITDEETVDETQNESDLKNEAFTDEQPDKDSLSVDATELDQLINSVVSSSMDSPGNNVNSLEGLHEQNVNSPDKCSTSLNSSLSAPGESIINNTDLISNIPADLFQR